jgi:putative intracellular protease/amidase
MNPIFKTCRTTCAIVLVLTISYGHAQKKEFNVAVFLYEGMELLDFAGPAEVFSATNGFNVYSVSVDGKPLKCNATGAIINEITPDYAMSDAPVPYIVVIPGGRAQLIADDKRVIDWVKDRAAKGSLLMSVCSGALVLANTGLLDGKNITTYYTFIPELRRLHPELTVLENTRFVDNGMFVTTAGVSAGIDGALHLVSKIKGRDVAMATAKYMEYDKWDPTNGRVDFESPYIGKLRTAVSNQKQIDFALSHTSTTPYEGELKNLAFEFREKGEPEKASMVLEQCLKLFPDSRSIKMELASVYRQLGRPAPQLPGEDEIALLIEKGNVNEVLAQYDRDNAKFPGWILINHGGPLTHLAIKYYEKKDYSTALKIFQLIAKADPGYGSFYNVGEVQTTVGQRKEAIENYRRALEWKPADPEVLKIIAGLEAK